MIVKAITYGKPGAPFVRIVEELVIGLDGVTRLRIIEQATDGVRRDGVVPSVLHATPVA